MSTAQLRSDILCSFSTEKTVFFGHSLGGAVIGKLIDGQCDLKFSNSRSPQVLSLVLCKQYQPVEMSDVNIMGFGTFEGYFFQFAVVHRFREICVTVLTLLTSEQIGSMCRRPSKSLTESSTLLSIPLSGPPMWRWHLVERLSEGSWLPF